MLKKYTMEIKYDVQNSGILPTCALVLSSPLQIKLFSPYHTSDNLPLLFSAKKFLPRFLSCYKNIIFNSEQIFANQSYQVVLLPKLNPNKTAKPFSARNTSVTKRFKAERPEGKHFPISNLLPAYYQNHFNRMYLYS